MIEGFIGMLLAAIFVMGVIIYGAFSWGFVASKFYIWFVLSIFPGLPTLGYLQFVGIMLFLSVVLPKHIDINKSEIDNTKSVMVLLSPWIVFIIGWLFKILFF